MARNLHLLLVTLLLLKVVEEYSEDKRVYFFEPMVHPWCSYLTRRFLCPLKMLKKT